jgi:hypothetical protein
VQAVIGPAVGQIAGCGILVAPLYEMERRNLQRDIATVCLGAGDAAASAIER